MLFYLRICQIILAINRSLFLISQSMPLKTLHTTDWHIGQNFYDYDRTYEHEQFLGWLVGQIKELDIDVLLMSGDIFDVANPSAHSQKMFYQFLRNANRIQPHLQIIMIAGNHDSAARLEAPKPLLEEFNTTIVGAVRRKEDKSIDLEKLLIPVVNKEGERKAWCLAIPFLRQGDYPPVPDAKNPYTEGVAALYLEAYQYAVENKEEGEAIIAMGHLHAVGAKTSEDDRSERVIIGGVEFIPVTAFHEDFAYTALGHIHKAQRVGGREHVRYAGSPLPMSFSETNYRHQLIYFELEGEQITTIRQIDIPVTADLIRVPAVPQTLEKVMEALAALPDRDETQPAAPYLEVRVLLKGPEPSLKHKIQTVIEQKQVRLARIDVSYPKGEKEEKVKTVTFDELHSLQPLDVFKDIYSSKYKSGLPDELIRLFNEAARTVNEKELKA